MDRCPDCNSDRVITWDDGYICCGGCEFDEIDNKETQEEEY